MGKITDPAQTPSGAGTTFDYTSWPKGTRVVLANVPWDSSYEHIVRTANIPGYVNAHGRVFDRQTPNRIDRDLVLDIGYDEALDYNYVMATNPSGQRFFYFINGLRYGSTDSTHFDLELDVWATYGGQIGFVRAYGDHGHIAVGNNRRATNFYRDHLSIPEEFDLGGDYVQTGIEGSYKPIGDPFSDDNSVIVLSTTDLQDTFIDRLRNQSDMQGAVNNVLVRILHKVTLGLVPDTSNPKLDDAVQTTREPYLAQAAPPGQLNGMQTGAGIYVFGTMRAYQNYMSLIKDFPQVVSGMGTPLMIPNITKLVSGLKMWDGNPATYIKGKSVWNGNMSFYNKPGALDKDDLGNKLANAGYIKHFCIGFTGNVSGYAGANIVRNATTKQVQVDLLGNFRERLRAQLPPNLRKFDKFLTYPYSIVELTNWMGSTVVLKPDSLRSTDLIVKLFDSIIPGASHIAVVPLHYNTPTGTSSDSGFAGDALEAALPFGSYPTIGQTIDQAAYARINASLTVANTSLAADQGLFSSLVGGAARLGAAASEVGTGIAGKNPLAVSQGLRDGVDAVGQMAFSVSDQQNAMSQLHASVRMSQMVPQSVTGGVGTESFTYQIDRYEVRARVKIVSPVAQQRIGYFWNRFGYAIGGRLIDFKKYGLPLKAMSKFSYWKLTGLVLSGNAPESAKRTVRSIFESGTTYWDQPGDILSVDVSSNQIVGGYGYE